MDSNHSIFLEVKKNVYPNYLFQRPQTELVVHRINLLSTVIIEVA